MPKTQPLALSRRERQIMEIIYRLGRASAAEVMEALPDPPGYSAVRGLLRVMEQKGYVRHVREGPRYVYLPTHPRQSAGKSALWQVVQTFFGGSVERAVATLLDSSDAGVSDQELQRLEALIEQAREGGRE
jgi:BlaI family transcriptional regulator, penicillinase repressor